MTRLLIIGPPGSGKGTQAVRIAAAFRVPAISVGDIFRANVRDETPLGLQAKQYMDSGAYVPDELTNELVVDRLEQPDVAGGFLLDGFPRTEAQVGTLDALLARQGVLLDAVVQLVAAHEEVVRRLLLRAVDQGRSDDTEDVIRHRLDVYEDQTAPLVELYAARGLITPVDALGPVDTVTARIFAALGYDGEAVAG